MKDGEPIKGATLCTIILTRGNNGGMMIRALARGAMDGRMNNTKLRHFAHLRQRRKDKDYGDERATMEKNV